MELNRLKVVLAEKKRTGLWLSHQLGVSSVTVSKWCSNITQPTLPVLDRIADILEIDTRELIKGKKSQKEVFNFFIRQNNETSQL